MTIEESILERLRALSPDQQQLVLRFAGSLSSAGSEQEKRPLRNPRGAWKQHRISLTDDDITEARRESWKNFPRAAVPTVW